MSAPWTITNAPTAGNAASATLSQPSSAVAQGQQIRVRSISATLSGSSAGSDTLTLKDGSTVLKTWVLSIAANGYALLSLNGLDIRVSGTLTLAFAAGISSDSETVNAEGDFCQNGLGYGVNPA